MKSTCSVEAALEVNTNKTKYMEAVRNCPNLRQDLNVGSHIFQDVRISEYLDVMVTVRNED
jgi:hypothetical protein